MGDRTEPTLDAVEVARFRERVEEHRARGQGGVLCYPEEADALLRAAEAWEAVRVNRGWRMFPQRDGSFVVGDESQVHDFGKETTPIVGRGPTPLAAVHAALDAQREGANG